MTLFDQLGGKETLAKVHKIFYDKIYADPWLGQFFKNIKQEIIENQQTDFMMEAMGGPKLYNGAFPVAAHQHMFISEELFEYRHHLLKQAMQEANLAPKLAQKWLKIDSAFKNSLVKKSLENCKKRFATDELVHFPKPDGLLTQPEPQKLATTKALFDAKFCK